MRVSTVCVVLAVVAAAVVAQPSAAFPPVWPMPQSFTNGTQTVIIDPNTLAMVTPIISSRLNDAFGRFVRQTFPHKAATNASSGIDTLYVAVQDTTAPLQLGMNESYRLIVNTTGVFITAPQLYGAYRALETLSQLIFFDFDNSVYRIRSAPWVIVDAPRFPHRGLLIDSSRHFLPLETIKIIIDSASYAKLNTIHWHIVDAIAFPFDAPSHPILAKKGAYSSQERYTTDDVADIVEYARARGLRVMVELDTPGHSGSMCFGMPQICPVPACTSSNINNWALDPTLNLTYSVINNLLTDLSKLFPEKFVHLGGDEVDYDCWSKSPRIMKWLQGRGMSLEQAYEYYVKRVQKLAHALSHTVVGWQEIWDHFGTSLDPRTVIQQWLPDSIALPRNVTSHGYRLIWSDSSVWYLDHLDVTWQDMYTAEPCNGLTTQECSLVLGGEACMWGETVDTSDSLQTIWPRAAAVAERLWGPRGTVDSNATAARLKGFRCLLNRRGIAAAPVDNDEAREAPPEPGSCYAQ